MIYFDNAATTEVFPCAAKAAFDMMSDNFANPHSLHDAGIKAEMVAEKSREKIASAAGVEAECLYFTGGGTISDNIAICGYLKDRKNGRIITSSYEHPAVLECFKSLSDRFEVIYINPENGIISPDAVEKEMTDDTLLVSIMHVNNETGAVNPIKEISSLVKKRGAVFHTDAVQGFLKVSGKNKGLFDYSFCDMASFSGHKLHAPKGIGALYIRKGLRIKPVIFGGGQEKNIYSGTLNTSGIAGFSAAVSELWSRFDENYTHVSILNSETRKICRNLGGFILSPEDASPYIINVAFHKYVAENILHYLSSEGIFVSTGSACSSKKAGHVMKALRMEKFQKNNIRISFSEMNTANDVRIFSEVLQKALSSLIKTR